MKTGLNKIVPLGRELSGKSKKHLFGSPTGSPKQEQKQEPPSTPTFGSGYAPLPPIGSTKKIEPLNAGAQHEQHIEP